MYNVDVEENKNRDEDMAQSNLATDLNAYEMKNRN